MSTVQLANEVQRYMTGVVSPQEQARLGKADLHLSRQQQQAISLAYSESFRKGMVAATAVSGVAILLAIGAYRPNRLPLLEQRQILIDEEIAQRAASHGTETQEEDVKQQS